MARYSKYLMCNLGYYHEQAHQNLSLILVDIVKRKSNIPFDVCSICGKPLRKTIYVLVTRDENIEYIVGEGCMGKIVGAGLH